MCLLVMLKIVLHIGRCANDRSICEYRDVKSFEYAFLMKKTKIKSVRTSDYKSVSTSTPSSFNSIYTYLKCVYFALYLELFLLHLICLLVYFKMFSWNWVLEIKRIKLCQNQVKTIKKIEEKYQVGEKAGLHNCHHTSSQTLVS